MSTSLESKLPETNVEDVARELVAQSVDLDGSGLVRVFGLLVACAEAHQRILVNSARTSEAMLSGNESITQEGVNTQLLDTMYETTCLKLFLARVCRRLAEDIEFDLHQRQSRLPRIQTVLYSSNGEVESFSLEPG